MLPSNSGLMGRLALRSLDQTASVYARGAGGKYDGVPVKSDLKCQVQPVSRETAPTAPERAELANLGSFYFEAGYAMPSDAQLAIDAYPGARWNILKGTVWADIVGGVPVIQRCDIRRVSGS